MLLCGCAPRLLSMGAPRLLLLLVGGLWVQSVGAGSHSFRALYSALSAPPPGMPLFTALNVVDDVETVRYPGETGGAEPRAPWMSGIEREDPEYWKRSTENLKGHEQVNKANVRTVMGRVNQTGGLHVVQRMYGCELRSDGSTGGFSQYAFDGRDFISFDKDRMTFTAASEPARITQDRWNSDRSIAQRRKGYMEGRCIEYLKKYLQLGRESLQRRVRPETMVYRKKTDAGTALTCYGYSFYPREIEVKWVRNGVEMPWKSKQILPNPDGTYQVKTTVELHEGDDEKTYTCQVDHSSLEKAINVVYENKSSPVQNFGPIIIGVIVWLLLLLAAIGGFVYWKKRRPAKGVYAPAQTAPEGGSSSSTSSNA